ncbi:hypothetical protein QJS04_geneDACA004302 [Acorus gramineus]|uniref:Drought induced 19 protein type zinc-binding domain-containing protein n=1 Tax=Acorus gramineus TaxID=55184 RepID=A0AAV9B1X9_ACOGR|nr:hypothetical protein QJS04_geneDACA004302 [Acorus gramineus]
MDVGFWASRVHSSNYLSTVQVSRLSSETHLIMDDVEGDEDIRTCFPCPFCYVEIEIHVLCTHLTEEHCFDTKNAVCPVCAENLGRDMIGHFIMQHAHMLKRRKCQRTGSQRNSSTPLRMELREPREPRSFIGVVTSNRTINTLESVPDPLLSPFLYSLTLPDVRDNQGARSDIDVKVSSIPEGVNSKEKLASDIVRDEAYREMSQRANFFQQLTLSTMF